MGISAREMHDFGLTFAGATADVAWEKDILLKVGGKMFLAMGMTEDAKYSFKVPESVFLELTDQPGIIPAPYLARARWVQIDPANCMLTLKQMQGYVRQSYELVVAKLPARVRNALQDA